MIQMESDVAMEFLRVRRYQLGADERSPVPFIGSGDFSMRVRSCQSLGGVPGTPGKGSFALLARFLREKSGSKAQPGSAFGKRKA